MTNIPLEIVNPNHHSYTCSTDLDSPEWASVTDEPSQWLIIVGRASFKRKANPHTSKYIEASSKIRWNPLAVPCFEPEISSPHSITAPRRTLFWLAVPNHRSITLWPISDRHDVRLKPKVMVSTVDLNVGVDEADVATPDTDPLMINENAANRTGSPDKGRRDPPPCWIAACCSPFH